MLHEALAQYLARVGKPFSHDILYLLVVLGRAFIGVG
jgi:hypothetical protein